MSLSPPAECSRHEDQQPRTPGHRSDRPAQHSYTPVHLQCSTVGLINIASGL